MKKATSLQRSLSSEIESNPIAKLDQFNALPLSFGQGLRTLQSVITRSICVFFCALKPVFCIGRGGVVRYKSGLSVKATRRTLAVLNTPIALRSNHLRKHKGAHLHA